MTTTFELLQGASIFTMLDLRIAYHLVRIREGDEWCGEYKFFRKMDITQEKGLCSESVTECEKQVCR